MSSAHSSPRVTRAAVIATLVLYVVEAVLLWLAGPVQTILVVLLSIGAILFGLVLRAGLVRRPGRVVAVALVPLAAAAADVAWFAVATGVWFASVEQARWAVGRALAPDGPFWVALAAGVVAAVVVTRRFGRAGDRGVGSVGGVDRGARLD